MKKRKSRAPGVCPVCGEDVPPHALACPECGADERSGWKEGADSHDGLDLPEEEFDYDDFVKREFGGGTARTGLNRSWVIVALVLLGVLLWGLISGV